MTIGALGDLSWAGIFRANVADVLALENDVVRARVDRRTVFRDELKGKIA